MCRPQSRGRSGVEEKPDELGRGRLGHEFVARRAARRRRPCARGEGRAARHPDRAGWRFAAVFESIFAEWMRALRQLLPDLGHGRQPAGLGRGALLRLSRRARRSRASACAGSSPAASPSCPACATSTTACPTSCAARKCRSSAPSSSTGIHDGLFVLPGTHNKWATVKRRPRDGLSHLHDGRVLCAAEPALDPGAHARSRRPARRGRLPARRGAAPATAKGLLHNAFGARTLALFERMPAPALASYLSGLLIGEELRTQPLQGIRDVVLIGAPALTTSATLLALKTVGIDARALGAEATWAGAARPSHGPANAAFLMTTPLARF